MDTLYRTKKIYGDKLLDPRWQKKRLEVLNEDNFTCQYCGETDKPLHIHHFCYNKNGNPWDVEKGDLVTLCEDCHLISHTQDFTKLEREFISLIRLHCAYYNDKEKNSLIRYMNHLILKYKSNGKQVP